MPVWMPPSNPNAQMTPQQLLPPAATVGSLDLDDIQGDVIVGLQKRSERFVFFTIADVAGFKRAAKSHLPRRITSASLAREREVILRDRKLSRAGESAVREPAPLPDFVGLNVAFTHFGISKLVPGATFEHPAFTSFAKSPGQIAATCGDAADPMGQPAWDAGFLAAAPAIDGAFVIAAGTRAECDGELAQLLALFGPSISEAWPSGAAGDVRPRAAAGHEHFGWKDGISQPAVEGLAAPFPGQPTVPASALLLGADPSLPPPFPWMTNGSFMVLRKLAQSVEAFEAFVATAAHQLGMDPALLGARMVGRWKSGAPLALAPLQDDPVLGARAELNNDFDFAGDDGQRRCPFGAHIRKVNPRADLGAAAVRPHLMMRAGIPYGPEFSVAPGEERGLLFVSYQASIANQFEFVQQSWANNPGFVFGRSRPPSPGPLSSAPVPPGNTPVTVGVDPLIGQLPGAPRFMDEPMSNYPTGSQRSDLRLDAPLVIARAGIYLFVPSLSALEGTFSD